MSRLFLALVCLSAVAGVLAYNDVDCTVEHNYCQRGECHTSNHGSGGGAFIAQDPLCACPFKNGGARCDYSLSECLDKPCANGGTCTAASCPTGARGGRCYTCACPPGWTGPQCLEPTGCLNRNCHNGASCVAWNGVPTDPKCICPPPPNSTWIYALPLCDLQLQFNCALPPFPCQNGGTCSPGPYCLCPSGFEGQACERVNFCSTNTCLNGGTCQATTGTPGGYCDCPPLYTGTTCELLPFCHPNAPQCQNGGVCNNGTQTTGSCTCPAGFWGKYCENAYTPEGCALTGCSNGGTCKCSRVDNSGTGATNCLANSWNTACSCSGNWGDCVCNSTVVNHCSTNSDVNYCNNGGTCISLRDSYVCQCRTGFYGARCENYDNICADGRSPCQNNGRCSISYAYSMYGGSGSGVRPSAGYAYPVCDCEYPFYGEHCEMRNDVENLCYTTGNPCLNGGNCTVRPHNKGYYYEDSTQNNQRVQLPPYKCLCPNSTVEGKYGLQCESLTPLSPYETCSKNPGKCQNGGTCLKGSVGPYETASCACRCGWAGDNCEVASTQIVNGVNQAALGGMLTFCPNSPCMNGGTCLEQPNGRGFFCGCMPGWWGTRCQNEGRSASSALVPSLLVAALALAVAMASSRRV